MSGIGPNFTLTNVCSPSGGFICNPRKNTMASVWMMKPEESVAIIGGMRTKRMSRKLKAPMTAPEPSPARMPSHIMPSAPFMTFMAIRPLKPMV